MILAGLFLEVLWTHYTSLPPFSWPSGQYSKALYASCSIRLRFSGSNVPSYPNTYPDEGQSIRPTQDPSQGSTQLQQSDNSPDLHQGSLSHQGEDPQQSTNISNSKVLLGAMIRKQKTQLPYPPKHQHQQQPSAKPSMVHVKEQTPFENGKAITIGSQIVTYSSGSVWVGTYAVTMPTPQKSAGTSSTRVVSSLTISPVHSTATAEIFSSASPITTIAFVTILPVPSGGGFTIGSTTLPLAPSPLSPGNSSQLEHLDL